MKKSTANKIKKILRERGETQQEFAEALGFSSRQSVLRRFRNDVITTEKDIRKICNHLKIKKEELGF